MSDASEISIGRSPPETVLPAPQAAWSEALTRALGGDGAEHRVNVAEVAQVAASFPRYLDAWATLAELAGDDVQSYAYARVGYHRGLDALRSAGWKGSGYVRWSEPSNLGFLRSLDALRLAAQAIGELDEEERCELFLRQLDPKWRA